MRAHVLLLLATGLSIAACGDDADTATGGRGEDGEGGAGGVSGVESGGAAASSSDVCERALGGPPRSEDRAIGWSAAHANIRFFGTVTDRGAVDDALAVALSGADPWSSESLKTYAQALGTACAVPASTSELGPASVQVDGDLAIVRPGAGEIALPASAARVVLDLRGIPESPDLPEVLAKAVAAVSASPLERHAFAYRQHDGLADEVYAPLAGVQSIYTNHVEHATPDPIAGAGPIDLPLVVLTEARMAPSAATIAIELRLANRAFVAGEDLLAAVGESKWVAVGNDGVLFRDHAVAEWPDTIAADVRTEDPMSAVDELFARGEPEPIEAGVDTRDPMRPLTEEVAVEADVHDLGHGRATLVVAHGAARLFFPYFPVVGDTIDDGLLDALAVLETSEGQGPYVEREALRRFSTHLHDSHGFTFYLGSQGAGGGTVPVLLDMSANGEVVIRTSSLSDLVPGDEVLEIDGVAIDQIVSDQSELTAASNDSALVRNALQLATIVPGDSLWHVRSPEGTERDVAIPVTQAQGSAPAVSARTEGFLDDLGAPGLYYINLDGEAYDGTPSASTLMTDASAATGLILDGRGYPSTLEAWDVIRRILEQSTSVKFRVPRVSSFDRALVPEDQAWTPSGAGTAGHFDGPVVVIVGPWTQSQAEHILMPLVSTDRVTFVGRQSAGANGNITGVMLPSARGLTFTGMETLFDDGSTFHGIGIQPTVTVYPDVATLAAGGDPELDAAIALLSGG